MRKGYRGNRRSHRQRDRHESPLLIITDDHHPGEALLAFGRLLYRYRSELAPFALAALTTLAALILHARHPAWWPLIVAASVVAAAALLTSGSRLLDRLEERVYAAAVALLGGSWLAAATALGPGTGPLPGLLVLGTFLGALPWWRHRRRRARVRVERTIEAWPETAEALGLAGSRITSAVADLWGWRARIHLRRGQTPGDVRAKLPAIESGLGTRPGAVRVEADPDRANEAVLRVLDSDPHARPIPWPGPSTGSITDPIGLGLFEDAEPVAVSLLRRHALLGGIAGSGKSGVLNVILGNLVACPDVALWGIDLKGGMELRPWAPCLERLATTPSEAAALLDHAVRALDTRARRLSDRGTRVWEPSPQAPALVIVIDEYAELTEEAPTAVGDADSIARRGRAVAVTLLAATQRPTQGAMGRGAVRSQMDVRLCLRVRERRDTDLVLGQGMHAAGWHADTLDAPGKFLVSAPESDTPRRARAYLLNDERVHENAKHYKSHRPASGASSTPGEADRTSEGEDEYANMIDAEVVDGPPDADSDTTLCEALQSAPYEGLSIRELMDATGMGRTWVYDRLQEHSRDGRVLQVSRGRWRARTDEEM